MNSPSRVISFVNAGHFNRPLCDADLRRRRDYHGTGARHGVFGTPALRDAGLRRLRCGLAAHRLARRPLEPPPHDADLLRRHRSFHDLGRLRADPGATRRGAVHHRHFRLDLSSRRYRDDRVLRGQARPRNGIERRLGQSRRCLVGAGHRRDRPISRLAFGLHRPGRRDDHDRHRVCDDGRARGPPARARSRPRRRRAWPSRTCGA
ncbi:hypothetical protein ACVWW5_002280 [Bradyrhizobium sp. LM3.4]